MSTNVTELAIATTEGVWAYDANLEGESSVNRFAPDRNEDDFGLTTWTLEGRVAMLDVIYAGGIENDAEIAGERIIVVAVPRLVRTAEASAIGDDGAETGIGQRQSGVVKCVAAERPAVDQRDRTSSAPILEIEPGAVCGGCVRHRVLLSPTPERY